MSEIWRDIEGYETHYQISNLGNVRSKRRFIVSKAGWSFWKNGQPITAVPGSRTSNYRIVTLSKNSVAKNHHIHKLVLEAFIGYCPKGMQCCHLDGNPRNNRLENLRWDTPKANAADRAYHGKTAAGWRCSVSKTAFEKRQAIWDLHNIVGYPVDKLSRIFAKPKSTIENLIVKHEGTIIGKPK